MLVLRHIVPAAAIESGLAAGSLGFTDAAIDTLVGEYSAEPGVRELARAVTAICRGVRRLDTSAKRPSITRRKLDTWFGAADRRT